MKFRLKFERLESRDNPSGYGSGDPEASLPPVDPVEPPPAPIVDPAANPGSGDPGNPPADPVNPPTGW